MSTVAEVTDLLAATVAAFGAVTSKAVEAATDGVVLAHEPAELPAVSFAAPPRNSYDYRLVVSRKLYDRAVGTAMSRSLANLAPGSAAHVNPLDLDSLGLTAGDDVKLVEREGDRPSCRSSPTRRSREARSGRRSTSRAALVEEIIDVTAAVTDVRIERV